MQRDLFDPDATVYVYESPTTLFVLLPHEARHRGFEAVLSMLLCSSRNCLPVSQTISGQVPDTLPGLEEAPWKARWEELRRLPPVLSKGSAPVSGLPFAMDEGGAGGLSAVTDPAQDPLAALQEDYRPAGLGLTVLCGVALALLLSLFNGAAIRRKINSLNRVRR